MKKRDKRNKHIFERDWENLYGKLSKATKRMKDYDKNINAVISAFRQISEPPKKLKRKIGFISARSQRI